MDKYIRIISYHHYKDEVESTIIFCLPKHDGPAFITQDEANSAATTQASSHGENITEWKVDHSDTCRCLREGTFYRDTHTHVTMKGKPNEQ